MNKKRKSQNTILKDVDKYNLIYNPYMDLLSDLQNSTQVVNDPYFSNLVNFHSNKEVPKHNWLEYKHGYSEKLVEEIIRRNPINNNQYILDPFTGVGTTNLVAQSLGFNSIGFDINPISVLAAKVKTHIWTESELIQISEKINKFSPVNLSINIPKTNLLSNSFEESDFIDLMKIKGFYEEIKNETISDFFKLAYISIIEDCSNRVKDGNGIKYARGKKRVNNILETYKQKCNRMLGDNSKITTDIKIDTVIIEGSFLCPQNYNLLNNKDVGLVIFSPPYANCFDYFEVYKLEMWMGGFVEKYEDFKKFRSLALRSHVNSSFDHTIDHPNEKINIISDTISCFNIWNKNIPDMIKGYFDDMTKIFQILYNMISLNATCYIVVANSGYRGVLIPTDLLLADISRKIGFKDIKITKARSIRSSSQQMLSLNDNYASLLRESIIEFKKT